MALTNSPLFQEASRQIQAAARRQMRQSDLGRMLSDVQRAVKGTGNPADQVQQVMRRYAMRARPTNAIRQLMGAEFGDVVRAVQRYGRGGTAQQRVVTGFLDALGPVGSLIARLASPGKTAGLGAELQSAVNLIQAFGGEVLPGSGKDWSFADVERGFQAALRRMQEFGFEVVGSNGPPRRLPQPEEGRSTIDVSKGRRQGTARVPDNHPMVTGEMVSCPSSTNVYEFGYDIEAGYLYVRFQANHKKESRGGAGSLYRYSGVTPGEFLSLYRLRNQGHGDGPGVWVWDVLRIRGTVSGHKKDYELVGIMDNYVPRKATIRPVMQTTGKRGQQLKHPRKIGLEEWYEQRSVKTHEGRWARSVLPTARVTTFRGPH